MNTTRSRLHDGTRLNGYTIRRYIDRGGFSLIYLAEDRHGKVLLKEFFPLDCAARIGGVIRPAAGRENEFSRWMGAFVREAQALVKLSGIDGVPPLVDFFEANGTAYIATEYVLSATFSDYIDDSGGKLAPEEALLVLRPLFSTLAAVHERGVLHLDVSPDNILIGADLTPYLIDFGTAGALDTRRRESSLKDGYSAPELYSVHFPPTVRSDVYSLGAVVYRAVTGFRPPSAPERARGHALAVIPETLETALCAAMSLSPARRPASVRAFADMLGL